MGLPLASCFQKKIYSCFLCWSDLPFNLCILHLAKKCTLQMCPQWSLMPVPAQPSEEAGEAAASCESTQIVLLSCASCYGSFDAMEIH